MMKKIEKNDKCKEVLSVAGKVLLTAVSLLPCIVAVASVLYYIFGPGVGYFHADCADSIYWANASVEAGRLVDPTFMYAGMVLFPHGFWMMPLIKIFGLGITVHNVSMAIFAVLFAVAVWCVCRELKMSIGWCSAAVGIEILMLSSSEKLREIMWGHSIYYSVGLLMFFAVLAVALRFMKSGSENKKVAAMVWGVLLAAVSVVAALDDMQIIVLSSLPVAAALIAERLFCGEEKLTSKKSVISAVGAAVIAVGTVVGLKLLSAAKGDVYSAYAEGYSGWTDVSEWAGNALLFVRQYLSLLGVAPDMEGTMFTKDSLTHIIRIAVGLVVIVTPIVMLFFYRRLSCREVRVALLAYWIMNAAVMFGFICGMLSNANWRLTPLVGGAVFVTVAGARELFVFGSEKVKKERAETAGIPGIVEPPEKTDKTDKPEKTTKTARSLVCRRLACLLLAVMLLGSFVSFAEVAKMPADQGRDGINFLLAEYLEDLGLEYGYATFWHSQVITVLTDSRVTVREIETSSRTGVYTDLYQSCSRWYDDDGHDRYFVLLSDGEYETVCDTVNWQEWTDDGLLEQVSVYGYYIFVFSENKMKGTVEPIVYEKKTDRN